MKLKLREKPKVKRKVFPARPAWKFDPTVVQAWAAVAGVFVTVVTSGLIWYVTDQQRELARQQVALEYATVQNYYRVNMSYRTDGGLIDYNVIIPAIPWEIKIERVQGAEQVTRVEVLQVLVLNVTDSEKECRVILQSLFSSDSHEPLKITRREFVKSLYDRRYYAAPVGRVAVGAGNTYIIVSTRDVFGKDRTVVLDEVGKEIVPRPGNPLDWSSRLGTGNEVQALVQMGAAVPYQMRQDETMTPDCEGVIAPSMR